ncbi:MAG: S-methyl-5'-thioadenosine phosphorylase [Deltaproteobacteria bacterium]|nr:S-methyl-5'-thioadenosine phosphorylase [Deltaproteobacteria bacterium]
MPNVKVGVIGGSGFYKMEELKGVKEVEIDTPFGKPSDSVMTGTLDDVGIAFLPRHGKGHRLTPSEVPYRANIYAMKSLGVEWLISVNAVGGLKFKMKPGDLVIPDQIIDCTRSRATSFFGEGIVAHVPFADPFCPVLSQILFKSAVRLGAEAHPKGTCVAIEGPAFSTRAESKLYRSWDADIIGMTLSPEARLAREAEICYAGIAGVTDYDSWQDQAEPLSVDVILETQRKNIDIIQKIIKLSIAWLPPERDCVCSRAMKSAIATGGKFIPAEQKKKLELLTGKYLKGDKP